MPYPISLETLILIGDCAQIAGLMLLILLISRKARLAPDQLHQFKEIMEEVCARVERAVREEIAGNREEMAYTLGQTREEIQNAVRNAGEIQNRTMLRFSETTETKIERFREGMEERFELIHSGTGRTLKSFNDSLLLALNKITEIQHRQLTAFSGQISHLTETNQQRIEQLRSAVEEKLAAIQENNARHLEQMRVTVDEKLQGALEKRITDSFRLVSERLEQVYRGLGEMQSLAAGVGDLKRVLTNVKTRGTWGEVQLGAMLAEVMAPDQYAANVATHQTGERVEYAIRLPGTGQGQSDEVVWLPIDAKFPLEDYQRLLEATDRSDIKSIEDASKQLESRIKSCAGDIRRKYINPPETTDFAILFLPIEGLFAEAIRRTGLCETLQQEYRIILAGPTTLWSILNSLQLGFRSLAIQKHSSQIWKLLAAVKTEWTKYGEVLEKVQKKIGEAAHTIDQAQVRTRAIGRKLKDVEELPLQEASAILNPPGITGKDQWEDIALE